MNDDYDNSKDDKEMFRRFSDRPAPTRQELLSIQHARFVKAQKLANLLRDEGMTAEDMPHMTDRAWKLAARAAGVNVASPITQSLVGMLMADREEQGRMRMQQGHRS